MDLAWWFVLHPPGTDNPDEHLPPLKGICFCMPPLLLPRTNPWCLLGLSESLLLYYLLLGLLSLRGILSTSPLWDPFSSLLAPKWKYRLKGGKLPLEDVFNKFVRRVSLPHLLELKNSPWSRELLLWFSLRGPLLFKASSLLFPLC